MKKRVTGTDCYDETFQDEEEEFKENFIAYGVWKFIENKVEEQE